MSIFASLIQLYVYLNFLVLKATQHRCPRHAPRARSVGCLHQHWRQKLPKRFQLRPRTPVMLLHWRNWSASWLVRCKGRLHADERVGSFGRVQQGYWVCSGSWRRRTRMHHQVQLNFNSCFNSNNHHTYFIFFLLIYLIIYLFIDLFIHLFIYLFIYLSRTTLRIHIRSFTAIFSKFYYPHRTAVTFDRIRTVVAPHDLGSRTDPICTDLWSSNGSPW